MERLAQIAMIGIAAVVAQLVLCLQGASSWQHPALSVNRLKSWTTKARPLPAGQVVMAGIVLGYRLQRDGTPSKTLEERVDMGLHLFDQGLSKWLVFSGGLPRGQNVTEAEAMKQYALQATSHRPGVERWKLERRSRSTRENALFSLEIAAGSRWQSVAVVTSPFHQLRAGLTFACAAKQSLPESSRPEIWVYQEAAGSSQDRETAVNRLPGLWWLPQRLLEESAAAWDFYRELAALGYYWLRGWMC
ncbi:hypothetical protein WJX84_010489 [Apatococcus fuscideae]|uniref:DUF218 domain-containing protein n=1 Tax=Apatococcus fuscideae TaxID=2026836 RepID=A0AAW1T6V8_9CHLO